MAGVLKAYRVHKVTGDRYGGAWPEQEFSKHGISYQAAEKDKSALYLDFLPMVLSGRVELLDNKHLFNELRALERRTRKGGRDLVDHPPRGHDDLANAVAGVCTTLGIEQGDCLGLYYYMRDLHERLTKEAENRNRKVECRIHLSAPKGLVTTIKTYGGVPQRAKDDG